MTVPKIAIFKVYKQETNRDNSNYYDYQEVLSGEVTTWEDVSDKELIDIQAYCINNKQKSHKNYYYLLVEKPPISEFKKDLGTWKLEMIEEQRKEQAKLDKQKATEAKRQATLQAKKIEKARKILAEAGVGAEKVPQKPSNRASI